MRYSSHERFKITYPYIHKNMYFKNYYKIRALSLLAHVVNIYIYVVRQSFIIPADTYGNCHIIN